MATRKSTGRGNGAAADQPIDVTSADEPDEDSGPLTNVEALHDCIKMGFDDLYVVEKQIKAKEAEVLSGLKAQRTKLWRQLKADTGITRKLLSVEYARYKLVRQAADGSDEDAEAYAETQDNLRTVHMALFKGESVDWVKALEGR